MPSHRSLAIKAVAALDGSRFTADDFAVRLAALEKAGTDLAELNLEDLFLAWAASKKDPIALVELDGRLSRVTRSVLGRFDLPEATRDEVEQLVRQRVLVGDGENAPRLQRYSGKGALVAWLKTVATSIAIDERRKLRPERHADEDELKVLASGEASPESRLLNLRHKEQFSEAFKSALAALSTEQRTYLKMRYVDGQTIEDIGRAFTVHRTTAMRWLESAQKELMAHTRRALAEKLNLKSREIDSLLREVKPSLAGRLSVLLTRKSALKRKTD